MKRLSEFINEGKYDDYLNSKLNKQPQTPKPKQTQSNKPDTGSYTKFDPLNPTTTGRKKKRSFGDELKGIFRSDRTQAEKDAEREAREKSTEEGRRKAAETDKQPKEKKRGLFGRMGDAINKRFDDADRKAGIGKYYDPEARQRKADEKKAAREAERKKREEDEARMEREKSEYHSWSDDNSDFSDFVDTYSSDDDDYSDELYDNDYSSSYDSTYYDKKDDDTSSRDTSRDDDNDRRERERENRDRKEREAEARREEGIQRFRDQEQRHIDGYEDEIRRASSQIADIERKIMTTGNAGAPRGEMDPLSRNKIERLQSKISNVKANIRNHELRRDRGF